ncbi:Polyribonucleotide nucleotidyltransferase [Rickettsiales endosymbiont of Paramecium tredecaurelia]|uniref:polyribonucleotide nucleotidyltransferase n=1 Tax=Candidatus Sarmatiella mevalonica TaxID=2770581 RepID=UPI00397774A3|nr:Polyribonucleotide nucleotidyltransferase [Candidatus Sarmatiella mevalonica]
MFHEIVKEIDFLDTQLRISTGKIANQANGSVVVQMGESVVLCTVVSDFKTHKDLDFFPLTVTYREMFYSAGKIPGGFVKREGKSSEREVLVSRLIDRPLRPLFADSFLYDTQVVCTVLSYDANYNTDILSVIGASAALAISDIPVLDTIAAMRVGMIDDKFVLNPTHAQLQNSKLDLVLAGTAEYVMMVECEANILSQEQILEAIECGHSAIQPVIQGIKDMARKVAKVKKALPEERALPSLYRQIEQEISADILKGFEVSMKQDRYAYFHDLRAQVIEKFTSLEDEVTIKRWFNNIKSHIMRLMIANNKKRVGGRGFAEIRPIHTEVGILPKTHGSALFTRGETQSLVVTTLGVGQDEQIVDSLDGEYKEHFLLNYIFPPYSVGEVGALKAPSRREVGHAKLAWRALRQVTPTKDQFPYTTRVVSEITACNGSSSMATICGASMSMMDAGVPLKEPVAGIAMGLIKVDSQMAIISDITGEEDALGDMDLKVAATKSGLCALQMDIKVPGITLQIIKQALQQAQDGIKQILAAMNESIALHRPEISKNAPVVRSISIPKDRIGELIGPGGKIIKQICEMSNSKIDIGSGGEVLIFANTAHDSEKACSIIQNLLFEPVVGASFTGKVVKIIDRGAFVNYTLGRDGFLPAQALLTKHETSLHEVLREGQEVKVVIAGTEHGKVKLRLEKQQQPTENMNSAHRQPINFIKKREAGQGSAAGHEVIEKKHFK